MDYSSFEKYISHGSSIYGYRRLNYKKITNDGQIIANDN